MPTYDFECRDQDCPKAWQPVEVSRSMTATHEEPCASCGQPMAKLISRGVSPSFKGSGFHVNDYPRNR